jgi:hypothetical protein
MPRANIARRLALLDDAPKTAAPPPAWPRARISQASTLTPGSGIHSPTRKSSSAPIVHAMRCANSDVIDAGPVRYSRSPRIMW